MCSTAQSLLSVARFRATLTIAISLLLIPTSRNVVVAQDSADSRLFMLTLSPQILPAHWTVIQANSNLQGTGGQVMRSDPWDRIDLGFLPGDCDGSNTVNTADHTRLIDVLQGQYPVNLSLHDINRDGQVTVADKTRLEELLHGINTTRAWNNYELPARP